MRDLSDEEERLVIEDFQYMEDCKIIILYFVKLFSYFMCHKFFVAIGDYLYTGFAAAETCTQCDWILILYRDCKACNFMGCKRHN